VLLEERLVFMTRVLRTLIRVVQNARGWMLATNRSLQCGTAEVRIAPFARSPANNLAAEEVEEHGDVQPSMLPERNREGPMKITLANWEARMTEDLRLRDYRTHTQEAYLDAVRKFLNHVREDPDALGEEDLRHYVLHLRDERKLSASYRNIAVCGLRFFFQHCLGRDWEVFDLLRVQRLGSSSPKP
jgi:hypothetical protein